MTKKEYFYFGKIIKPHGYKGDLTVRFDVSNYVDYLDVFEDLSAINAFFVEENEHFLPYFIENIETKNKGHFKLKFEDVDDESTANSLRGKDIYYPLEKEIKDEIEDEINTWVGFSVFDEKDKKIGLVNNVVDFSGNILLQVTKNNEDILIPFIDEMIIQVNNDKKEITMEIPEGLIEMNE